MISCPEQRCPGSRTAPEAIGEARLGGAAADANAATVAADRAVKRLGPIISLQPYRAAINVPVNAGGEPVNGRSTSVNDRRPASDGLPHERAEHGAPEPYTMQAAAPRPRLAM
jgi:hypothetical protein